MADLRVLQNVEVRMEHEVERISEWIENIHVPQTAYVVASECVLQRSMEQRAPTNLGRG